MKEQENLEFDDLKESFIAETWSKQPPETTRGRVNPLLIPDVEKTTREEQEKSSRTGQGQLFLEAEAHSLEDIEEPYKESEYYSAPRKNENLAGIINIQDQNEENFENTFTSPHAAGNQQTEQEEDVLDELDE